MPLGVFVSLTELRMCLLSNRTVSLLNYTRKKNFSLPSELLVELTQQDGRGKPCVTSVTIIFLEKTVRQTSAPFNGSFCKRLENINVNHDKTQNTRLIGLSRLSHTSVLPSSSFCRPGAVN